MPAVGKKRTRSKGKIAPAATPIVDEIVDGSLNSPIDLGLSEDEKSVEKQKAEEEVSSTRASRSAKKAKGKRPSNGKKSARLKGRTAPAALPTVDESDGGSLNNLIDLELSENEKSVEKQKAEEETSSPRASRSVKKAVEKRPTTGKKRARSKGRTAPAATPTVDETDEGSLNNLIDLELSENEKSVEKQEEETSSSRASHSVKRAKKTASKGESRLYGKPVPVAVARERWPHRYKDLNNKKVKKTVRLGGSKGDDEEEVLQARCHYEQAEVDGCIYNLNDDAYVKGEEGAPDYIGRIIELFETEDRQPYFTAQWFFKAEDTVINDQAGLIDNKRVFHSELTDDNPLDCIVSKIRIVQVAPDVTFGETKRTIPPCDFYFDMSYSLPYSTIANISAENSRASTESTISSETSLDDTTDESKSNADFTLLDLYSGCGAMSTGLCLGANLSGINLVTKWAVDINKYACESLKLNHPETEVRNESAEDFLQLLKEWEKFCKEFCLFEKDKTSIVGEEDEDEGEEDGSVVPKGEFEVGKLLAICYGDPNECKQRGIYFKVRWKGYGPSEDTWEGVEGLSKCRESIKNFVTKGFNSNILPLPGDVDVICGGPPCQGISGFNRFRNKEAPLNDTKNHQLVVFMDIVNFLKPKFVLMENVVDILKFARGFLVKYAVGRLVSMNYQARLGMMAAGCYGLPQFRMRVFLWGARPTEKLPQYPLPTHEVVVRGNVPVNFEKSMVAYDEKNRIILENALLLEDAISDLPPVTNDESRDEMPYGKAPKTDFQQHIRLSRTELMSVASIEKKELSKSLQKALLFDHRPLKLNEDDYQRVCRIPKKKGANFRDLPGVLVRPDKKVEWDKSVERVYLPSGKPLVPDYAMTFVNGSSSKPFGRLWWDEIVATVVTRAEPHNQVLLHPEQDRVLTIRENARLQGFPDFYRLCGPIKERYIQVGNAVAVPVSRALGYALGLACQGNTDDQPLLVLPPKFPNHLERVSCSIERDDANCSSKDE
ncbi:putative DNA (cytosine-5)-methyltransferase CMT1 isoform X2 [Macadamia integrifolia]|uniref:putative DNA (cytosine-5)-methyltransferase CMT1 isoform X2 n=1 Tax=Macadamia integrifolia TaxID=60698 RepID=UPI001C53426E|nr:putative DNA (cytosine-5)-methyltransferase CMT1 isoform X2 [Macadamia integrifolia]